MSKIETCFLCTLGQTTMDYSRLLPEKIKHDGLRLIWGIGNYPVDEINIWPQLNRVIHTGMRRLVRISPYQSGMVSKVNPSRHVVAIWVKRQGLANQIARTWQAKSLNLFFE